MIASEVLAFFFAYMRAETAVYLLFKCRIYSKFSIRNTLVWFLSSIWMYSSSFYLINLFEFSWWATRIFPCSFNCFSSSWDCLCMASIYFSMTLIWDTFMIFFSKGRVTTLIVSPAFDLDYLSTTVSKMWTLWLTSPSTI